MSTFQLSADHKLTQNASLSQRQQYSLRVLAMPVNELNELVERELAGNPVIEYDDGFYDTGVANSDSRDNDSDDNGRTLEPYDAGRRESNRTLREELLFQLMTGDIDVYLPLGEYIISCLDDNGYLRISTVSIATATGILETQVEQTIASLQRMEPTGVFARDLKECLLLQLRSATVKQPLAERITEDFLELVGQNRPDAIAKETGTSLAQVKDAITAIKSLNPRPGSGYYCERTDYILPDVKVTISGEELRVATAKGATIHINPYYTDRLPLVDPMTRDYLKEEIAKGRGLISCLEQRQKTLMAIAVRAVEHQRDFFLRGAPLLPFTMGELSEELGIHESTVSRAVSGKYLQYAKGTMPLSELFCGKLVSGDSSSLVKLRLRSIVEQEDKSHPYSDATITDLLGGEGVSISRRCVAKYREELGIPTSQLRKKW